MTLLESNGIQCIQCTLVIQGVDLFALKFYLDGVVPINHSWPQKTRDTGLPDGKEASVAQYRSVTDRRTDLP